MHDKFERLPQKFEQKIATLTFYKNHLEPEEISLMMKQSYKLFLSEINEFYDGQIADFKIFIRKSIDENRPMKFESIAFFSKFGIEAYCEKFSKNLELFLQTDRKTEHENECAKLAA